MVLMDPRQLAIADRDPCAVFVLILCVVSGIPLMLHQSDPIGSLFLPEWAKQLWIISLVAGAAIALTGMAMQKKKKKKKKIGGLLLEQFGNVAAGSALIFYSFMITLSAWPKGVLVSGILLGFGASCLWRWYQIQRDIKFAVSDQSP